MPLLMSSSAPMSTPPPSRLQQPAVTRSTAQPTQRSFTLPARLANAGPSSSPSSRAEIGASAAIETLYVHPGAKIVSFSTAGSSVSRPSSSSGRLSGYGKTSLEVGDSGSLPWHNATERTLAAGPLEIYRVPGSVSFLHSGSLLHAILPRSQCWLVDGVSTFAFRVRPDQYYRLELPGETSEDLELVEGLKETLGKVLYYERTNCPFRRGLGDELPEMPDRRRTLSRGGSVGPAKKWKFERRWRPDGMMGHDAEVDSSDSQTSRPGSLYEQERGVTPEPKRRDEELNEQVQIGSVELLNEDRLVSPVTEARGMRSVTAPQLSLRTTVPAKSKVPQIAGRINEAIKTQTEAATSTPVRRRQLWGAEAPTPQLPPTPESLKSVRNDKAEESHEHRENSNGTETTQNIGLDGHEDQKLDVPDSNVASQPEVQLRVPKRTPLSGDREVSIAHKDAEKPTNSTLRDDQEIPKVGTIANATIAESAITPIEPGEETPKAAQLATLQPSAAIEIPYNAPPAFNPYQTHLQPSHNRQISSDCDYAQDTTAKSGLSTSPALSLTPSPDPSTSSMDSWTSLPATPLTGPSTEILNTLRLRRGRSTASSSSDSYHSLTAPPSIESLPGMSQQQQQLHRSRSQQSLQPPKPTTRARAPSTSALIAQTSALFVKRTASLFLGPPAHLVALMLRIAARFVAGGASASSDTYGVSVNVETETETNQLGNLGMARSRDLARGQEVRGRRLGHRRVPGSFEFSDDEEEWGGM